MEGRHDRRNFFHGLSRSILSLTRIPLPRIGSFKIDENGYLSLSKRPLTLEIQQLENEHIPVDIPRGHLYKRCLVYNRQNCISRKPAPPSANRSHQCRRRPLSDICVNGHEKHLVLFLSSRAFPWAFFLNLTDMNQNNVFVDDEWNIKCLIDLEWACSHPVEMIPPPCWLTNQAIDGINSEEYGSLHAEFMTAFAEEEAEIKPSIPLHPILQQGWDRGTFWCVLALLSPSGLFSIFYDHIQPRFTDKHREGPVFWTTMTPY